jgi:cation diffusion facilitator family transporter
LINGPYALVILTIAKAMPPLFRDRGTSPTPAATTQAVRRVLWTVLWLNAAVALAKLVAGVLARNLAVQSDGVHSTIDALNNVVGLVALRYAAAPPDVDHPYGHGKIETLAAFGVAGFITLTAFELARAAAGRLVGTAVVPAPVGPLVPGVMLATLVINILVSRWEQRRGTDLGSHFLLADAAHTRSDILVTCAVLGSWLAVSLGYPAADGVTSLVVVGFILRLGYQTFARTIPVLIDAARLPEEQLRQAILSIPGVLGCERLRHRGEGRTAFVECQVRVEHPEDGREAHQLSEMIEERLQQRFGIPRENVTIHIES